MNAILRLIHLSFIDNISIHHFRDLAILSARYLVFLMVFSG